MFEYLKEISERLYSRYMTIESNIKSKSNSFFDAFLDMAEEYIKIVTEEYSIDTKKARTAGEIMRLQNVNEFFINNLNTDPQEYERLKNYISKINKHKHNNEKQITFDIVMIYMKLFDSFLKGYCESHGIHKEEFDADYFVDIFDSFSKENKELAHQVEYIKKDLEEALENGKIKEKDIEDYKLVLEKSSLKNLSLEQQNTELRKQLIRLKDIKISIMEEKLNKTIDLLTQLTQSVIENRAISYAVGDTLCGSQRFKGYVDKAREDLKMLKDKEKSD